MNCKVCIIALAVLLFSSCTVFRGIKYGNASIDDYTVFEQDVVAKGEQVFEFAQLPENARWLDTIKVGFYSSKLDSTFNVNIYESMEIVDKPAAVVLIQNDTIIYEKYYGGWDKNSKSNIFSVTKSITAMLCGIALQDGYIKSLQDPVTDYIPELRKKDTLFDSLKIEHLLDMTSGLKFNENYGWNPFSKMARLYMGNNAFKVVKGMKFIHKPGEYHHYDSMTSAILGIVIERATGTPYAQYLSEKVWQPLGMEQDASMSLDSKKHRVAKAYGGLTTNVRDLAKVGKLYIDGGKWNGKQIIDSAFVARTLSQHLSGITKKDTYSYSWYWGNINRREFPSEDSLLAYYSDAGNLPPGVEYFGRWRERKTGKCRAILHMGGFWGFGLYGQVLYINPKRNFIGVFLGADRIEDWQYVFEKIILKLENE